MTEYPYATPTSARKKIMGQGINILRYISEMYSRGEFENPQRSLDFCSLLMLIAEDKVKGNFNEETSTTEWALNENFQRKLEELRESILSSKVVPGPWPENLNTLDS